MFGEYHEFQLSACFGEILSLILGILCVHLAWDKNSEFSNSNFSKVQPIWNLCFICRESRDVEVIISVEKLVGTQNSEALESRDFVWLSSCLFTFQTYSRVNSSSKSTSNSTKTHLSFPKIQDRNLEAMSNKEMIIYSKKICFCFRNFAAALRILYGCADLITRISSPYYRLEDFINSSVNPVELGRLDWLKVTWDLGHRFQ